MSNFLHATARGMFWTLAPLLPDELRLKLLFRRVHNTWPNLIEPGTFSEKVQWRKLHDRPLHLSESGSRLWALGHDPDQPRSGRRSGIGAGRWPRLHL